MNHCWFKSLSFFWKNDQPSSQPATDYNVWWATKDWPCNTVKHSDCLNYEPNEIAIELVLGDFERLDYSV